MSNDRDNPPATDQAGEAMSVIPVGFSDLVMQRCFDSHKKIIYFSKSKAEAALRSLQVKNDYQGCVYPCPCCNGFHLGRRKANVHVNKYRA